MAAKRRRGRSDAPKVRTPSDEPQKRKQAVVIVHGMGEQRPLGTLRSFAEAVWGGSTVPDEKKRSRHNDLWIVPDNRAGLTELARIRTRNVRDGDEFVGTDFYELYWADKLTGNTLAQFRSWIFTLLLRWPHQVPRETAKIWACLWAVTVVIILLLWLVGRDATPDGIAKLFSSEVFDKAKEAKFLWLRMVGTASVVVITFALLCWRLRRSRKDWSDADRVFAGTWQTTSAADASLRQRWDVLAAMIAPFIIGGLFCYFFPWSTFPWIKGLTIMLVAALVFVITSFIVPYFGDVARYVRAAPDAVSARADIRERGLALMRALHGMREPAGLRHYDSGDPNDYGDPTPYDRIVVVGHSLGSIIAYDVLRLLWEEIGPTARNAPKGQILSCLNEIDGYCGVRFGKPDQIDPVEYRRLQGELIEELRKTVYDPLASTHWLVSDFVTLGSPLTHAEFLVSPDRHSFEQRKAERQFPTSPPMLEHGRNSFMYDTTKRVSDLAASMQGIAPGEHTIWQTHHAAMFAATRWVNIYDPQRGLIGDLVSGPCRSNFGPGIVDIPVKIKRPGIFGRIFTHTDYWNSEATSVLLDESWKALEDKDKSLERSPPGHIAALRLALRLRRRIPREPVVSEEA